MLEDSDVFTEERALPKMPKTPIQHAVFRPQPMSSDESKVWLLPLMLVLIPFSGVYALRHCPRLVRTMSCCDTDIVSCPSVTCEADLVRTWLSHKWTSACIDTCMQIAICLCKSLR